MMDRRQFVLRSCAWCVGAPLAAQLATGCESTRYVTGTMEPTGISVAASEFLAVESRLGGYRPYIIVRNDKLEYPICLYRFSDVDYSALLMKCTHQGTELQAAGDHLHCPAHGSEFSNKGKVSQGPAEVDLRTFRVVTADQKILIELK